MLLTVHSGSCGPTASPSLRLSPVSDAAELPGAYVAPASLKGSPLSLSSALTLHGSCGGDCGARLPARRGRGCRAIAVNAVRSWAVFSDTRRLQSTRCPGEQTGEQGPIFPSRDESSTLNLVSALFKELSVVEEDKKFKPP